jgi:hypothetical protein
MVAQVGEVENYSVYSEMHEVRAVKVKSDLKAMPSFTDCAGRMY